MIGQSFIFGGIAGGGGPIDLQYLIVGGGAIGGLAVSNISVHPVNAQGWEGGGGGAGADNLRKSNSDGAGGLGGGGNGGDNGLGNNNSPGAVGEDGDDNTGGAGGGGNGAGNGGVGGSGVVILRYPSDYTITVGAGIIEASGSPFTEGTDTVSVFTGGTGNISFS